MTDPAEESRARRIDDAIKSVAKHIGGYVPFNPEAPPFNHGISLHPEVVRRYLDLNAKDAEYMFHEHNIFIGQNVRITGNGTVQVFECTGRSDADPECAVLQKDGVFHSKTVRFDRLEIVPSKIPSEFPDGYKSMSPIGLTQDEATEQFAFYMVLAHRMFEMMPRNMDGLNDTTREEVERLMVARGESKTGSAVIPALAFYDASIAWYEEDNKKWED